MALLFRLFTAFAGDGAGAGTAAALTDFLGRPRFLAGASAGVAGTGSVLSPAI